MPRQFFIAPLVCTVALDVTTCTPKVNPQQVNFVAACQDATVANAQCLVLAAGDTSGASADNQLVSLVDDNLDTTVASLSNNVRNRIQNGLNTKGIPITLANYATLRDFTQALGAWFDPNFTVAGFWVSD